MIKKNFFWRFWSLVIFDYGIRGFLLYDVFRDCYKELILFEYKVL